MRQSLYGTLTNTSILLDDVVCTGTEDDILQCPRVNDIDIGENDCTHMEDAGVRCDGELSIPSLLSRQSFSNQLLNCVKGSGLVQV